MKRKILLSLYSLFLILPIISFTLQSFADTTTTDSVVNETLVTAYGQADQSIAPLVYTMVVDGAIGTVDNDRIDEAIETAEDNNAELLVIQLDTPGGFTESTWSICKNILNSRVPVCVYISPAGARAGSAGVYITYSANFAAMASSTNIGAAHPVSGSGEKIDSVMNEKITNDAVAQIRAAAEKRIRNAEWAERAVRESVSITANEAVKLHVVDFVADNMGELLEKIDGDTTVTPDGDKVMHLKGAIVRELTMSTKDKFLKIVTSPDIAFILFSIGGLGIMLELYNPGSIFPGVIGAIAMILALYSFSRLPINYAGIALIALGILLFILEIKIVSYGLLTVGGIVSFILGGFMLIDSVDPALKVSLGVLITVAILFALVFIVVVYLVVKAAKRQPFTGNEGLIGKEAKVRKDEFVYLNGALWKAESEDELAIGDKVKIVGVQDLTLKVKKI